METFTLTDSNDKEYFKLATENYCWNFIEKYAKDKNLGHYYRMNIIEDGYYQIDYGSHTHFFYMKSDRYK